MFIKKTFWFFKPVFTLFDKHSEILKLWCDTLLIYDPNK